MDDNQVNSPKSSEGHSEDKQFPGLTPVVDIEFIDDAENPATPVDDTPGKRANPFPVEVFPAAVQQIINATNESLNFPIDFIGASILYTASVAIGNSYRVEVKKGFQESAVIYLAIVARAGTNKSHPLSFALRPIFEQDKKTYYEYTQQRQEYERINSLSKKNKEQQCIEEPKKPIWNKMLLSDFTPEALAQVHQHNTRGVGVYCDELAGWFKNFNRYNKGSEMEFWISVWSAKPVSIDRKSDEPVYIPLPFISVAGTIQTGVLNELAKDSRTENGFIDRILFVMPDNLQKTYWSDTDISQDIITNWQVIISNLLSIQVAVDSMLTPVPETLYFTPEAKDILYTWQKRNVDESNGVENEPTEGIFSKLEMYAARLALILELMGWACRESSKQAVTTKSVKGAIKLVEYFKNSAFKVYSIINNTNPVDLLPADKRNLYNSLPETFTTEQGLEIAKALMMPQRNYKRFLSDKRFFNHPSWGNYEKLF